MRRERSNNRFFRQFGYFALAILSVLLVSGQKAFAQVDEGSISGTVADPTGATIADAKITLLNTDVGLSLEVNTSSSGDYSFSPVRIGHYTVTATAAGFSTTTQQNLVVSVGQHLQVNVQLKPGAATETVTVTTAPPQLQTEESSVGQVVSQQTVNNLPLNGRNFTFLAQLGAGVGTPQADTRGNAASGAFTANGLRPSQNNYLLDGIDNNSNAVDFLNGTNFVVLPPVDAIQEFKVQTGGFSAELGRSAGAVLNATIKSGTNSFHGAAWEFFRNDKLDAADWFENNQGIKKGALRFNQFGASLGGPIIKNKIFFFGDYEGFRRVQGTVSTGSVPTLAERASNFTDLSDIVAANGASRTDILGRIIPSGTILDPATTRSIGCGEVDPVSGIAGPACAPGVPAGTIAGYARDPFGTCGAGTANFTLAGCGLNQLPAGRLDANAIKLLNLYPNPTSSSFASNYARSPGLFEHRNAFDTRVDFNLNEKDQVFFRFSYVDDPQLIPGIFGGVADGGGFQQGNQSAKSDQAALAYTHVFSPTMVNVARGGFNHLHTTRFGPVGTQTGIPDQYGIQGIPQVAENGGLPGITPSGLSTLGSNNFLPSDEISQTLQITDDFTKIYGKHNFKMGIEYQHVKFSTLQPAWSRGQWDYNGTFTDIPNKNGSTTGRAQMLLSPLAATVPNGVDFSGGSDQVYASNINKTYNSRTYFATYFQDDWKVTPALTLNLGLRWDYFSPINEDNGGQANFVQSGPPNGVPTYLIPATGKSNRSLSSTANNPALAGNGFLDLLAKDGIQLELTDRYGKGLVQTQKTNVAPRAGFAYTISPKLVARGGVGLFFNAFENQGYGPNIGENYPFVYNFNYTPQVPVGSPTGLQGVAPISYGTPYAGCGSATLNTGFTCLAFSPLSVNASQLNLQGLQFNYITPRTLSSNLTFQYALTHTLSAQVAYVFTEGSNLQAGTGNNNVNQILPAGANTTEAVPFPAFGHGGSYQRTIGRSVYNGLQTKLEQQFNNGLNYLLTYTFSKTLSDAGDLLNGGSTSGFRAPDVPGAGVHYDWGLANFDLRHVFHASGGYQLPIGKDKRFLHDSGKLVDSVVGGWSINWIATLQGGQPITLGCPVATTAGTNCFDVRVPGQSQKLGVKVRQINGINQPFWFNNAAAFQQPCPLGSTNPPTGCVPATGLGALGGGLSTTEGPGFHRLDFSAFKGFQLSERFSMQFRAEFFNILNHPNFNAPNFGGNGVVAISGSGDFTNSNFGQIGSTRDAPNDPRQIQLALKLYY